MDRAKIPFCLLLPIFVLLLGQTFSKQEESIFKVEIKASHASCIRL